MFDFDKAAKDAQKDVENKKLFLILLGSSGNGKSYAQGTFGVKTLYLYTQGESHGPKSASALGKENIVPVCLDREDDKQLTPDEALNRLNSIISNPEGIKKAGFKAIALDGASELEALIRETPAFKSISAKNNFGEGPFELAAFREILNKLKTLQRETGVHICVTCVLTVKDYADSGLILDSTPGLYGYQVSTGLIQQFDDVMIIGRMEKNEKVGYRLQLLAGASKETKDFKTKQVKKTFNFSPRLTGVDITSMGVTLDADLSKLIELKEKA